MNETWKADWDLALKMLNPTPKELEHGLELHRSSFVFDAYGFLPSGGGKSAAVDKVIAENGSRDEISAAREAFVNCDAFLQDPGMIRLLKEALEFSGVDCIFQNAGVEGNDVEALIKRLSCYTYLTDHESDLFERAVFPDMLENIKARGHKALYLTANGVPLPSKLLSGSFGVYFSLFPSGDPYDASDL